MNEAIPLIDQYQDEEDQRATDGWHIQDIETLDWALSRMADLKREIAENESVMEAAIIRLRMRTAKLNERAARGVTFFEGRVREYAEIHRKDLLGGGKKKSRALPHGVVSWRKSGGGFKANDKEALLAWAQKQPVELGFIRFKEEPAWDVIKAHCEKTGEAPPGVDVEPESETFKVEPISMEAKSGTH